MVFDFFGTLTDPAAELNRDQILLDTARVLGLDSAAYAEQMRASFHERCTGALGDTATTFTVIADRCGHSLDADAARIGAAHHLQATAAIRRPHPDASAVLQQLRQASLGLAVLSDCSSETVEAWESMPYAGWVDTALLSWSLGYLKPDPRGYRAAAAQLEVAPEDCWFVGDGGSREHWGAAQVG